MKKLFLVCLMMLAGSAWAEWVMFSKDEEATHYFDPATIRKEENMGRVWQLTDMRKMRINGTMSHRARYEYDCKRERFRYLGISSHPEPMAGGKPLIVDGEDNDWFPIAPGTIAEVMLKIVCSK